MHRLNKLSIPLLLCLTGCASTPANPGDGTRVAAPDAGFAIRSAPFEGTRYLTSLGVPITDFVTLPDWVVNPTIGGVLGSIGIASFNNLGTSHQVENARTSGRLEIARMLEVRVQEVGRRDVEQNLRVAGENGIQDQGSRKSLLGVDRNIADLVLAGSRQRALWFDPSSRDCYVWMVMDGAIKTQADHYVENGVSVYVANQVVANEFRPERPQAPVVAAEPKAPEPQKGPIEQLESRLKPIETIPVTDEPESRNER